MKRVIVRRNELFEPFEELRKMHDILLKTFEEDFFNNLNVDKTVLSNVKEKERIDNPFPMELKEYDDRYEFKIEVSGLDKNNINIKVLDDGVLKIEYEKKEEKKEETEEGKVIFSYLNYGKFSNEIRLPDNIEIDKINAEYKDGTLKIIIPKKKKEEKIKKIEVK